LGLRASFADYSDQERKLILEADRVFYPTPRFAPVLRAAGKDIFPSAETYAVRRSHVLQQLLMQYLDLPHPATRIYFGRHKSKVIEDFEFPMVVMGPVVTPNSRRIVHRAEELRIPLDTFNPVVVQRHVKPRQSIAVVSIGPRYTAALVRHPLLGYRDALSAAPAQRADLETPLLLTRQLIECALLDEVMAEWALDQERWVLLGLRRPPPSWQGSHSRVRRHDLVGRMIESGKL
jgi:hypothetical protein